MNIRNRQPSCKPEEQSTSRPMLAISILEVYVCGAILGLLFGLLYPATEVAREMQGRAPALPAPFDVREWSRATTLAAVACLTFIAPLFPCAVVLGIRRLLPKRWKKYIYWKRVGPPEPVRPMTWWERWVVIGVAGIVFTVPFLSLLYDELIRKPPPIPAPPLERNRIRHPAGFSLIFPEGWNPIIVPAEREEFPFWPNSLVNDPSMWMRESGPRMAVIWLCDRPPRIDEYAPVEFQGREAYEWSSAGDGANSVFMQYELLFRREKGWYEFSFEVPNGTFLKRLRLTDLPGEVRQYARTFREGEGKQQAGEAGNTQ